MSHQLDTLEGGLKFLKPKSYKMQINGEDVSAIVIQSKLFILHLLSYLIMLQLKFQLEYSYKMTYDAFKQYHCAVLSWKKKSISGKLCHS